MQPTQGDIVIPSEENVVRLPLGFRGKPKSQFRRAQYYCFDDSRYYELPFYIETEEDYDSSSSFDREFLAKALMAYAESKGVSSPDEFALELLSILDGKETTYDPNGPYL